MIRYGLPATALLLFSCSWVCAQLKNWAGDLQPTQQDSLSIRFKNRLNAYYVKPVVGLHRSYSRYSGGAHVIDSHPHDLRNPSYGLIIGYQTARLSVETGMVKLPVYTGFRFVSDDQSMVGLAVRVNYWQFPVTGQYILWKPVNNLTLGLLAGAAINANLDETIAPSRSTLTFVSSKPDGTTSTINAVKETNSITLFLSTSLGIRLGYKLLKDVDVDVQLSRLFSAGSIVSQDAQLRQNSDPTVYQVNTQAGAGGLSVLLGLSYQFHRTKKYSFPEVGNL